MIEFKEWTGERKVIADLVTALNRMLNPSVAPRTPDNDACRLNDVGDYCLQHEAEFHPTKERCPVAQSRVAIGDAEEVLSQQANDRVAVLEAEWNHAARHLAAICDAWDDKDTIEEIGRQVHQASAYLLAAGAKEPSAGEAIPVAPSTSSRAAASDANDPSEPS